MTKIKKRKNTKEVSRPQFHQVLSIKIPHWRVEEIGYTPITTLWQDFSIADAFGPEAIKDTYRRVIRESKLDYKYQTELVMVLNHKISQWFEADRDIAVLYNSLWLEADAWACKNLKGEKLKYFYRTTD